MITPWLLYQGQTAFVLGFHGTERALVEDLVSGKADHLEKSAGLHEWLGHGIYFWENDPQRGLEWAEDGNARKKIQRPAVVGAILDLGFCLDLTTRPALEEVSATYAMLRESYELNGLPLPANAGGKDKFKRELDCDVIEALHKYRAKSGQPAYDSVRAPFPEDDPLYDGAGLRRRNHIQIAVINPDCIKGYFLPIKK